MRQLSRITAGLALALALLHLAACDSGPSEAHHRARGARLLATNELQKARVELSHALRIDPHDARAHYLAGRVAERLQDPRDALTHYRAAIDAEPAMADARAAAGRIYLYAGMTTRALDIAEEGLRLAANDPQLLAVRAAARGADGDFANALEDAELAARTQPDDEYIVGLLSSLYRRAGQIDKAIDVATRAVERVPWSIALRYMLADTLAAANRTAEARAQLQEVVATEPRAAMHRMRLAQFLARQGDAAGAERALRDGITATADDALKVALVQLLARRQGAAAAQALAHQFLDAEPHNDNLSLLLGAYSEQSGASADAERLYRAVIVHAGTRDRGLDARLRLARLRLSAQDANEAMRLVGDVLEKRPGDADALFLRADLALGRADVPGAVADLRAILSDQPGNVLVLRALARVYQMDKQYGLAGQILRVALAGQPGNATTLEQLFRLQLQQQDYSSARETVANLQQAQPRMALGYYLSGLLNEAERQPGAALADYDRALQLQPDVVEPLTAAVRLDLAARHPDHALARLDAVIGSSARNAPARNLKAEILLTQQRIDAAVAQFNDAIGLLPGWSVPYRGLATAELARKQPDAAIATLNRGIQATGGALDLTTDLGAVYESQGRSDDAIQLYDAYLRRDPTSLVATHNLANLLVSYRNDQASLDRAAQLAAAMRDVDDPRVLNTRGWIAFRTGAYAQAVTLLQQALQRSSGSALLQYRLGMAQLKSGDTASARHNIELALKSSQTFRGADEARTTLAAIRRTG